MSELAGRTALVTGVGRKQGIGAAIAMALAQAGAGVVISWHAAYDAAQPWAPTADEPAQIVAGLRALGVAAHGIPADLADPAEPARLVAHASTVAGPLHILVNNAAYSASDGLDALDAATLDAHYAVNVRGTALLIKAFAAQHNGQPGGRIISMTSGQGLGPMPTELAYAASKGAIEALTLSLSVTLAAHNITVNAVDPGATESGWIDDAARAAMIVGAPFGRLGTPADAARLVCFLASDHAAWITGQVLRSRGGT